MPDLPVITLSQAHYDRVVAAFPGATLAAKAAAYKAWLTGHLIDFVALTEARALLDRDTDKALIGAQRALIRLSRLTARVLDSADSGTPDATT